jgi:DNA-directed RNA polymerase subunit RPC12/RpoP
MKPRNKHQRRIVDLGNKTFGISKQQKEWAFKECLEHKGFATKSRVICLDCGDTFSPQLVKRKKAICPHCNTRINVEDSRCTTDKQINYFAIAEVVEEFQVIKNFELIAYYKKGKPVKYFLQEIIQYWIDSDLKTTMFGLAHNIQGFCDNWHGSMEIRVENGYYQSKYDVYARKYHPKSVFKPEYVKIGINHRLRGLTFLEAAKLIPREPKLETLIKAKQYGLLGLIHNSYKLNVFWPSIKICLRNNYLVDDYIIYTDYLELLRHFNKDLRNPKYVCPKNLKLEHDRLVKKKRDIERKQELATQRKEIEKSEKIYNELKSNFFNLQFSSGSLIVVPLKSVQEFMEEGDILQHCVFTNKYYNRKESLILSARIDNKPIETIEVDLHDLKIIQSRGLKNTPTEHHDKIVKLVRKNMPLIKECLESTKFKNQPNIAAA